MQIPPALRNPRYRTLWLGMLISFSGSQMQVAALHWHIRTLSEEPNPLSLGGIGLARILPILFFSFFGGPAADTFNRRRILFLTQSAMTLTAFLLFLMTLSQRINLGWIYALTAFQAAAVAFDSPARQAMIPNIVDRKDLPNAFSLSSIAMNTGSILGPTLAGVVIATLGQEYTYLFNALSFLAVILALVVIGPVSQDMSRASGVNLQAARDGFRFIFSKPIIFSTMLLDFVATFFVSANTMMPIIARDYLRVGEIGYGWLSSAQAIGAVLAGTVISQFPTLRRQGPILLAAVTVFGLAAIPLGLAHRFGVEPPAVEIFSPLKLIWRSVGGVTFDLRVSVGFLVAFLSLMLMGAADAVSTIIRNTIRQLNTPDY
ncbi:MAG: MFS transporter, partial [Anaerolineales bacterium]|nr:MFS transporter [Anaerolineales bacterium]